jgi:outer membrane protein TolC
MFKLIAFLILLLIAQTSVAQNTVLESYIEQGIENNLALKQQDFSLRKSLAELKEARGLFLPSLNVIARYSRAGGGRAIEFPIGDILNPIYQALNIPIMLENEQILFMREKEQETKVRFIQPVFQPSIYHNYKIKNYLSKAKQESKNVFTRQLVADIKTAYFNYLITVEVNKILRQTKTLLEENLRVSESLFENNKATKEIVYRAKAELSELEQEMAEAEKNRELAASYFNLLLNRPLDENIVIADEESLLPIIEMDLQQVENQALNNRPELQQIKYGIEAMKSGLRLAKSTFLPSVSVAVDYGFQGEEYRFTDEDDFWMASAVLQWNLFNGFQDKAKVEQRLMEKRRLEAQLTELENQIKLQVREAYQNLVVARKSIVSAEDRLTSARKSFEIVNKKYEQGMSSQIEYLDARNSLTQAQLNQVIIRYSYQIRLAEFEKVTGRREVNK